MTAPAEISHAKPRRGSSGLPSGERAAAARLVTALRPVTPRGRTAVQLVDGEGRRLDLPDALTVVIARAAALLAEGHAVSVFADDEMLTTQEAADRLNVSRQYIVRLVDQGALPSIKVGIHRRLQVSDVVAYKADRDATRGAALDRLAALSEDAAGYQLDD